MEARTSKENEEEEEKKKKKEFNNDDSFLKKDKKEDEEEERRRIASLIAETSYLTSVLNAPSGEATTTASSSSSSNDFYDYYDFGFTSAVYSLFGYASEDGNTGSATNNNNNNINNNKMMMMMEKESNLLLDEKRIEQTLLKNHGVIKKTLPEVSPTDFEKYLRAIRTSYARFVATRAMAKKKNKSAGTASKSSSAGSALADGFAATNNMNADDFEEQMHRQNQLLSSVPSIFFREEFDLTSREAFEEILPCLVSDLVGESNNNNNNNNNRRRSSADNLRYHDILLDDRENAKRVWPKSLEQATRDAAAKINHDMRVTGRDGTTALVVMIKRALDTNIAYVKTAWVGDTRAVIRYKNRTFNLSEDHTAMNLNERSRMGQYYRARARKSRVLKQKADELKSFKSRRSRNASVDDLLTDSDNPSIEGGLAFKEWQEKSQAEKEKSIRGGSEMLTRFAGGRRASEVLKSRNDSFTQTSEAVREREHEGRNTPPPITTSSTGRDTIKIPKSNSGTNLNNIVVKSVVKSTSGSDLTQAQGAGNAAAKLADLSLKLPREDARKELKKMHAKFEEKEIKKTIRSLAAGVTQDDSAFLNNNHSGEDSSTNGSSSGRKSSSLPYSSSSEELEDSRLEPSTTQNFGGEENEDDDDDIYATLFPFKIEDIPRVHIDRSGLVSSMHSRRTSFLARIEHEETGGLSAPRIVARTGVSCAFSRSIGDSGVARAVICTPEFRDFTIACGEPARIVLASDGCWDVFTSDEATLHIESLRDADHTRTSDISTRGGGFHNTATVDASVRGGSNHSGNNMSSGKDGSGMYADLSVRFGQNSSFQESAPGIPAAQAAKKLAKAAKQRRLYRSYPPDDITVIVVDINLAHFEVIDQPGCSCVVS